MHWGNTENMFQTPLQNNCNGVAHRPRVTLSRSHGCHQRQARRFDVIISIEEVVTSSQGQTDDNDENICCGDSIDETRV